MLLTLLLFMAMTTQPATRPTTAPAAGQILLDEKFANLDHWHLEGLKDGIAVANGELRLDCKSKMGMHGAMAFCKQDFPDNISIDYDFIVEQHNGLFITFVAMQGVK